MSVSTQPVVVARREVEATPGLRRELGRLDTVLFLISAMVVLDTIGAISVGGSQVLTWLLILGLTFFVPSALISAELGAALPQEGGAYVWVRQAFGRRAGALTSLLYWAGAPVWVGGSVVLIALEVVETFSTPLPTAGRYAFGLAFLAVATFSGIIPLRYGKWVPGSGALAQIALLLFFTGSAVAYGLQHGIHGLSVGGFAPTPETFFLVVPVLLYSFVGVELPSSAGDEMRDPRRDVPAAILQAGIAQMVMYAVPVVAVLAVVPTERLTSLGGFVDALRAVLTVYGGSVDADGTVTLTGSGVLVGQVAAAVFVWVLLASATTWGMGAARTQAAACADGAGPAVLGRISPRTGVPVVMTLLGGLAATATFVVGLTATGVDSQRYFTVALTGAIAFDLLAFLFIYPAFLTLRYRRPDLERPFRVPGGVAVAWLVSALAGVWTLVAAVGVLWPGVGTSHPDAMLPIGFEGQRGEFEILVAAPIVTVLVAFAVHAWVTTRNRLTLP